MLCFLALASAILFVYFPAIRGGFVWDDDIYLTHHPPITDPLGLLKIWFDPASSISPYPMVFTTYWIEYRLWGFAPEGYHLVNLALHAMNAFLVSLILRRLGFPSARLAAIIFAVHPMSVESVAWITERKDVLSGLFHLLAIHFWLRHIEASGKKTYALAFASFVFAMLSKTVTCTFPVIAVLLTIWKSPSISSTQLRILAIKTTPMFAIALVLGLATIWWEKFNLVGTEQFTFSFSQRLLMAGRAPWFYLGKLGWPWPLSLIYQEWPLNTASVAEWGFCFLTLTGLLSIVLFGWRRRSPLALATGYFIITLTPALGFLDYSSMVYGYAYNHFQYLAGIGIMAVMAALLQNASMRLPFAQIRLIACIFLLLSLGLASRHHSAHFTSNETLFRANIAVNPRSWVGWYNVGVELDGQNKPESALTHYNEGLKINPDHIDGICNRANALMALGRLDEARAELNRALELEPDGFAIHLTLGLLAMQEQNLDESIERFTRTTELRPKNGKGHYNLGLALMRKEKTDEALVAFERAAEIEPNNPLALNGLGIALVQVGRRAEGIPYLQRAAALNPAYQANLDRALKQTP